MTPDLLPFFARIAGRSLPAGADVLSAAQHLSGGATLHVYSPQLIDNITLPGIEHLNAPSFPLSLDEELLLLDEVEVVLLVHRENPRAVASEIEQRLALGQRIVLVDTRYANSGDPALMTALLASTVYLSNLAAFDTDITRALLAAMIPLRDGQAHRQYMAHTMLYWWAWQGTVREEVLRRFGDVIPPDQLLRAITQARSRLGAYLVQMQVRGLRFKIAKLDFPEGRVEDMTFELVPVQ